MAAPPDYSPPIVKSSKPTPIDTSGVLGGLPVAEQTQDYFITFQQAGGTGPEIIGETAYFITYLVQSDGTLSKPAEGGDALLNLEQNFPIGKNVNVRVNQGTALNNKLGGEQTVTAIGRQQPILFTQTGFASSSFVTSSTNFKFKGDSTPPGVSTPVLIQDFRGTMLKTTDATLSSGAITSYDSIVNTPSSSAATFNTSNGTYTLIPDSQLDSVTFQIIIDLKNTLQGTNVDDFRTAQFVFEVQNDGSTYQTLAVGNIDLPSAPENIAIDDIPFESLTINYSATGNELTNAGSNPKFRVRSQTTDSFITVGTVKFRVISQNPSAGTNTESPAEQMWVTGSGLVGAQWLTASAALSLNYGLTQDYISMESLLETNFNVSPIQVPFKLRAGDRIRFEYNKAKDFYIYEVIPPKCANDGLLKIKINQYVPSNTVLNNFIIHRTDVNDPLYIILDVDKDETVGDTQNFSGLILPKYPTKELINNLDNILVDLKEKGIVIDNEN